MRGLAAYFISPVRGCRKQVNKDIRIFLYIKHHLIVNYEALGLTPFNDRHYLDNQRSFYIKDAHGVEFEIVSYD